MDYLHDRLKRKESTNFCPQILVGIAGMEIIGVLFGKPPPLCLDAFSFGNVIAWGVPAFYHWLSKKQDRKYFDQYYNWTVTMGPLGAAFGIMPAYMLESYLGARSIIILQTPFMLLMWLLIAFHETYSTTLAVHFFLGFLGAAAAYCGEILLIETVHKNYLKGMYVLFKCSSLFGVVVINVLGGLFESWWLYAACAGIQVLYTVLLMILPDSPLSEMRRQDLAAEKSLRFYRGKSADINRELMVMRKYVQFNYGYNSEQVLHARVVRKAICIVTVMHITKLLSGYYAFLLDGLHIFTVNPNIITPYLDNVVLSGVALFFRFYGTTMNIRLLCGIRVPLILSMFFMFILLAYIGVISYMDIYFLRKYTLLAALCAFMAAYELGANMAPEILLFHYCPHQVYRYVAALMASLDSLLAFVTLWIFRLSKQTMQFAIALSIYGIVTLVGAVFVAVCVVEPRGRSLREMQLQLGGTPAGERGSWRRRIPHPLERFQSRTDLERV